MSATMMVVHWPGLKSFFLITLIATDAIPVTRGATSAITFVRLKAGASTTWLELVDGLVFLKKLIRLAAMASPEFRTIRLTPA